MSFRSAFMFWRSVSLRRRICRPALNRQSHFQLRIEALEDRCVPSTLNVTSNADNGASGTLRWAVAHAKAGDTADILTTKPIVLAQGELYLNKSLTIEAPAGAPATISGNNISRVFEVAAGSVNLDNLIIVGGNGVADNASGNSNAIGFGGGIYNYAALTLNGCTQSGNSAVSCGGGIASSRGIVNVNACTLSGNSAGLGGGALAVTKSILSCNSAVYGGGIDSVAIVGSAASLKVAGSTLSDNSATDGGGIYTEGFIRSNLVSTNKWVCTATISDCTLSGNTATSGGAIYVGVKVSTVHIGTSVFSLNTPEAIFGSYIDDGGNSGL